MFGVSRGIWPLLLCCLLVGLVCGGSAVTCASELSALDACRLVVEEYFNQYYNSLARLELSPGLFPLWADRYTADQRAGVIASVQASQMLTTPGVESFVDPGLFSEPELLIALIEFRRIQSIDLSFCDLPQVDLSFSGFNLTPSLAEIRLTASVSYRYRCLPQVVQREIREHRLLLTNLGGEWQLLSDSYDDSSGFSLLSSHLLQASGGSKELSMLYLLNEAEKLDILWNDRFAESLTPYADLMLFKAGQCYVWLGSHALPLDSKMDAYSWPKLSPRLEGDCFYLPLRALLESLGGIVIWEEERLSITIYFDEHTLVLRQGSQIYRWDGEEKQLPGNLLLVANRTLVPIEFFAELLHCRLFQDGSGLAILSAQDLTVARQLELNKILVEIYPARFSQELFVDSLRQSLVIP